MLAVGGGMLMPRDAVPSQVKYAMDLTGEARPRLCVLNTAAGDDPNANLRFYDRLSGTPAQVRHLALFPMPNVADPEDLLMSQDVIFVGGGSVANMVAVWRVHGIDEILRKAWHAGIVLAGSSAGGICWFEGERQTRSACSCGRSPTGWGCWLAASARITTPNRSGGRCTGGWSRTGRCRTGSPATTARRRTMSTRRWLSSSRIGRAATACQVVADGVGGSAETALDVRFLGA